MGYLPSVDPEHKGSAFVCEETEGGPAHVGPAECVCVCVCVCDQTTERSAAQETPDTDRHS